MPAGSLHGTTVAWSVEGLATDPMAEMLALVPPAERPKGRSAPDFILRAATPAAAADPGAEGWEPSFFHGIVQAYRGADGFLLWDRASRVALRPGAPVEAWIAPPEREIVCGSAGAMLQIALTLALRSRGLYHLHAAALRHPSGAAVLVVGGSGAGKTTTTLALLEAGADYLGDDALFLEAPGPGEAARILAFPREFHLGPATLAAFPRLEAYAGPPSPAARGDKRPVDPRRAYPGRDRALLSVVAGLAGRALAVFPGVVDAPTTEVAPLPRAEAFGHLLASSAALVIDGLPGRHENLTLLQGLVGAARCVELRLGRDVLTDPISSVSARIDALFGPPVPGPD
jgi:hypothetical protein